MGRQIGREMEVAFQTSREGKGGEGICFRLTGVRGAGMGGWGMVRQIGESWGRVWGDGMGGGFIRVGKDENREIRIGVASMLAASFCFRRLVLVRARATRLWVGGPATPVAGFSFSLATDGQPGSDGFAFLYVEWGHSVTSVRSFTEG